MVATPIRSSQPLRQINPTEKVCGIGLSGVALALYPATTIFMYIATHNDCTSTGSRYPGDLLPSVRQNLLGPSDPPQIIPIALPSPLLCPTLCTYQGYLGMAVDSGGKY